MLDNITLPETITSLGPSCFSGCTSLAKITLPETLTSLGSSCFSGCGLKEIKIPANCVIGSSCFSSCKWLSTVKANGNIDYGSFSNTTLTSLEIGEECNYIEQAYLSHYLYTEKDPDVEYMYDRYQIYFSDFTIPTTLKSLFIEDKEEPIELKLRAGFTNSVNYFELVTGSKYNDSQSELKKSWCVSF